MGDQPQQKPNATDLLSHLDAAEDAVASMQGGIERTHRLATLGTVAAGIAHEINNLLTPALAYCELARANPDDRELQAKALEKILKGINGAICIAGSALGFVADQPERPVADIAESTRNAFDCMARDPVRDGIRLACKIEPGILVAIAPVQLQQVLLNLVLNACNAMRGRGGSLTLTAIPRSDGMTGITVADSGPGIPPAIADHLFEPFVTSPPDQQGTAPAGRPARRGSGLGLAVCKQIIERSGGTITCESEPGQGTTFQLCLPTAPATDRAKAV
ncbi:MAG: sensor histidine kinase [Planctomycetota bacterium]|jgi:signal transduction histidine kinase